MRQPKWLDRKEIVRWVTLRCGHCGHRFRWKRDARFGVGDGKVYHAPCIGYIEWRRTADERLAVLGVALELSGITAADVRDAASMGDTAESNRAWRVFRDLERSTERTQP
jgi:hypothetical protein